MRYTDTIYDQIIALTSLSKYLFILFLNSQTAIIKVSVI